MILTDKERSLLKELAAQEKTCAKKYLNASQAAFDPQLKNLFSSLSQAEQKHLEMINSILSGTLPQVQAGGGETAFTAVYNGSETQQKLEDAFLCTDLLAAENMRQESMIQGCLNSGMPACAMYWAQYKGRSRGTEKQYRII